MEVPRKYLVWFDGTSDAPTMLGVFDNKDQALAFAWAHATLQAVDGFIRKEDTYILDGGDAYIHIEPVDYNPLQIPQMDRAPWLSPGGTAN